MGMIKINNIIYGSNNSADIIYKETTVEEKLDTIPIFDINDNGAVVVESDVLTYGHIVDNLNSTESNKILSAKQGKILNEKIDNIDFSPLEEDIANNTESINLLNTKVDENNTKIENNLSLIFNNWLNDCDVIEKIEEHVAIEGAGGTFMLAFGSNITNAPTEGLEWFIVLYKAARILAWRDDCLFTNARNGASDNYMGWKRYVSEDIMNNAINAIKNFIHKSVENYEDYWKLEMSATCSNTLEAFKASKPHRTVWIHDSATSVTMNMADSYTAKCTTNVYVDSDKNLTFTVTTDDESSIFVNKTLIASLATCTATSVTLPLKQGWNEIIVIYTEGSGADGWLFSPKLSAHSDILRMNACIDYI